MRNGSLHSKLMGFIDLLEMASCRSSGGTVVPWQLFPIDSTRAQSSQRALSYPSYIMVTHDDFASFGQRPHGLMEVIIPGDSWLFGTVLPGW